MEKFGETIFSTPAFNANPDMVEALYDIVNAGNLFFYNRGEAEPLQFTFRKATPTSKDVHVLPSPTNDPRLAEINAQRREQVKDEMQRYEAYRVEANKKKVLDRFKVLLPDKMVNARQRAHNALSLATPGPLEFLGGNEVNLAPVTIKGSPRYSPAEIETIVLAACDSQRAAAKNTSYPGMSNKDKMTLGLGFGVHEDMLVTGRKESDKDLVPVFEEGRKFAAELIEQEIGGKGKPLKNAMMDSLRNHILACRERPSLDAQSLRMFEEVWKMASMMGKHQLYTNKKEFDQLEAEAKAMGVVATAILAGAKAEQELQEAQRKGEFTDEKQRASIVGRIVTARYFTARHYQAIEEQTADPKIQNIQNKLKDLTVKEGLGQISPAKREVAYNKLVAQQTRSYKLPGNIHEIMNEMKQRDGAPEIRFWDYAAITSEGKKLMAHTDPFKMIEELTKLSNLTATNEASTTLTTEMQDMRTNRMDSLTANNFWKSMQRAMGDDQFDLKVMPDDFSRLVILQEDGSGNRSLVPLKETLDITIQDTLVRSMDDAAMMDRIRNQLAQGNVFFYERGKTLLGTLDAPPQSSPASRSPWRGTSRSGGSTTLLCLEGVPDLPVVLPDEAGLTTTFQTWPRGCFHIAKHPDFPVPSW